jgi:signal peptidase
MDRAQHGGGRRVAAAAPVRRRGHRLRHAGSFLWEAVSVALLGAALVLGVVCLVIPKILGAVPLTILSGSMAPTMPPGSLAVVRPVDATQARIGDVLSYEPLPNDPTLVTHRVIAVTRDSRGEVSLTFQGDANPAPDDRPVRPEQVQGSVVYSVPYFGWVTNRLNVGPGARYAAWAAYALIVVGVLRILLGLGGSHRVRAARSTGTAVGAAGGPSHRGPRRAGARSAPSEARPARSEDRSVRRGGAHACAKRARPGWS